MKNPIRITSAILGLKAFSELKEISDKETYGGAPLLGINGICIIGHGSSSPKAVCNAIKIAADLVEKDLNGEILKPENLNAISPPHRRLYYQRNKMRLRPMVLSERAVRPGPCGVKISKRRISKIARLTLKMAQRTGGIL